MAVTLGLAITPKQQRFAVHICFLCPFATIASSTCLPSKHLTQLVICSNCRASLFTAQWAVHASRWCRSFSEQQTPQCLSYQSPGTCSAGRVTRGGGAAVLVLLSASCRAMLLLPSSRPADYQWMCLEAHCIYPYDGCSAWVMQVPNSRAVPQTPFTAGREIQRCAAVQTPHEESPSGGCTCVQ